MDQYSELMARHEKLGRVWLFEYHEEGKNYGRGVMLHKNGKLRLPVCSLTTGELLFELSMAPGDTEVTVDYA